MLARDFITISNELYDDFDKLQCDLFRGGRGERIYDGIVTVSRTDRHVSQITTGRRLNKRIFPETICQNGR